MSILRTLSLLCEVVALALLLPLVGQFAAASNALPPTRPDGPEAVMASTKRDFGDVFAGEELEQNFPVRNAGTKPLELSQKSTLGSRSTTHGYPVRAAVWRPNERLLARAVAARPAAPG